MADETTAKVRRAWESQAPRYDRQIQFWERIQFAGGREWVCSRATGEVLEVAVGTGRNFPYYPVDSTLTGVDLSSAMLAIARRRAAQLGRSVDLREADAEALPFPDDTFDTVVCTLSLCGIPDDRAAIGEMWRVLRPGGRLLLLDHIGSSVWLLRMGQRLLETLTIRLGGEHMTRRPLPLVRAAGFGIDEQQRLKAGTVERLAATKPESQG
jgi:ubiquinone/menaquinone biosynthesis C-methylase UbiE